jgi:hypothetical protein
MTNQHPINPSIELITTIVSNSNFDPFKKVATAEVLEHIITKAAQWGADQELEACCELTRDNDGYDAALALRAARRPKSSSLKEQALEALKHVPGASYPNPITLLTADEHALIRRALEQLDDN